MAEGGEVELVVRSLLHCVRDHIEKVDETLRRSESLYRAEFLLIPESIDCVEVTITVTKHGSVRYVCQFTVREWSDFVELQTITSAIVDKWCHVYSSTDVMESGIDSE